MTPSRMTEVPVMPLSQLVRPEVMAASGRPRNRNISRPTTSDANSGMITTGIKPAEPARHVEAADPQRGEAGDQAADDAADEAAADEDGDRARDEARGDARPVGDRERDVAGQRGHQEHEGQPAEREQHRAEVLREAAGGQVGQRVGDGDDVADERSVRQRLLALRGVGDLVAAEQEAERDQQTAGGDERDHVADAGEQDLPDPGAPADVARRRGAAAAGAPATLDAGGVRDCPRRRAPRGSSCRAR